jgi:hypothetical protein
MNISSPAKNLNITVYGNVTGVMPQQPYPAPDDPQWANPNGTVGKIVDVDLTNNKFSTLFMRLDVLSFTPYKVSSRFCDSLIQGKCPLGPVFNANRFVCPCRLTSSAPVLTTRKNAGATPHGCEPFPLPTTYFRPIRLPRYRQQSR